MAIYLLQELPSVPLGPTATFILGVITVILAIINWRQRLWKSTSDAAVVEMNIHKETADRLRDENHALRDKASKLEAATNLEPLIQSIQGQSHIIEKWVDEGRKRFDDARNSLDVNSQALRALIEEFKSHRTVIDESHKGLTAAFVSHTLDDKHAQIEQAHTQLRIANTLDDLENRLSQVAVRVGMIRWDNKEDQSQSLEHRKKREATEGR